METHKIDSIIRNAINGSEDHYDSEADHAKERIWNQIRLQKQNHSKPALLRLLVAASILLSISLSVATISNIRNRNTINSLVELNRELRKESATATNVSIHDTITVEKKVIEYKPVVTTKQITDTVYIRQIVYVEKEQEPVLLATDEINSSTDSISQTTGNNHISEIFITSNESLGKERRRKFQIKFGCNKDQANSGTLAVTTNL